MNSKIVIVAYKAKPGRSEELKTLVREHYDKLALEGLVSERKPVMMIAQDGTIVEVFEWKSSEAIEKAHASPVVGKMWEEFSQVCDYIPLNQLPESKDLFAEFTPL